MNSTTNHWKLGLFVLLGFGLAAGAIFSLGATRLNREAVPFVTYFDESVTGLDRGAPVQMRGVTIGNVVDITIAPDQRMVEVHMRVYVDTLRRLGLPADAQSVAHTPSGSGGQVLRVQLQSIGITGVKFILADFFPADRHPIPEYEFPVAEGFVPSVPSTFKSIEDALPVLMDAIPRMVDEIANLAEGVQRAVEQADVEGLSLRAKRLLDTAEMQLAGAEVGTISARVQEILDRMEATTIAAGGVLETSDEALTAAHAALGELDATIARFGGEAGPLATVLADLSQLAARVDDALLDARIGATSTAFRNTSAAVEISAREAGELFVSLSSEMLVLRETLAAVQRLVVTLESDPASLLRGRASHTGAPGSVDH